MKTTASKLRNFLLALSTTFAVAFLWSGADVFAHGGEDHGASKPKTETSDKGTASHTTRVGDLEVMLKHERLIPDADNTGRLFVTKFETNEAFADVVPIIEIEAANGAVTQAIIEKTDAAGSFMVKIPALAQGTYSVRAKLSHGGETDIAAFPGVTVENALSAKASGNVSWGQTALTAFLFLVALALFSILLFLAARVLKDKPLREDAVSA